MQPFRRIMKLGGFFEMRFNMMAFKITLNAISNGYNEDRTGIEWNVDGSAVTWVIGGYYNLLKGNRSTK